MLLPAILRSSVRSTGKSPSAILKQPFRCPSTLDTLPLRGYATARPPPKAPLRRPPPSKPPPYAQTAARPPSSAGLKSTTWKTHNAERLFNLGDRTLYQSSKRTTFFRVFAFSLTGVSALGITYFFSSGLLDLKTYEEMGHDHPIAVPIAFAVVSLFLGAAAAWSLLRTWNHIHSIKLVKQSGNVLLQVNVRSGIPFLKRSLIIPPQQILVDSNFIATYNMPSLLVPRAPSETSPSAFTAGIIRETMKNISRFFYAIFDGARIFFSQEGVLTVEIQQEKKGVESTERYFMDAGALYLQEHDKIVLWDLVDTKDT